MADSSYRLNRLLSITKRRRYLEIGVQRGITFSRILAERLDAVDPNFGFDISSDNRDGVNFFALESDEYFRRVSAGVHFDVIFIDGLHTYQQSRRDLLNAISLLAPGGVIVLDDVYPTDIFSSIPTNSTDAIRFRRELLPSTTDGRWHGDVFKTLFFVHDNLFPFDYYTTPPDQGNCQAVLWRSRSPRLRTPLLKKDPDNCDFFDTRSLPEVFHFLPFDEILKILEFELD
jgi:hypothetical protein